MPKIPLYEQKVNVGTAQGVTIDGSRSVALAGAQASSENSLMRELVGLGQDFVNQKIKLKTNADKSKYALWEDDYTFKKEEERKKLQGEGKTEDEIYKHLTGSDFADASFKTWSKENDVIVTREMQNDWNEYKSENKKREFISLEKIKLEKNVISIIQKTDKLRLEEKHEEADAEIDRLPISPLQKEKYKTQGYYSYYLNKGQKLAIDGNKELLDALQKEALDIKNNKINFSQRQQLEIQFRSLYANLNKTKVETLSKEIESAIDNNSLTEEDFEIGARFGNVSEAVKKEALSRAALSGNQELTSIFIISNEEEETLNRFQASNHNITNFNSDTGADPTQENPVAGTYIIEEKEKRILKEVAYLSENVSKMNSETFQKRYDAVVNEIQSSFENAEGKQQFYFGRHNRKTLMQALNGGLKGSFDKVPPNVEGGTETIVDMRNRAYKMFFDVITRYESMGMDYSEIEFRMINAWTELNNQLDMISEGKSPYSKDTLVLTEEGKKPEIRNHYDDILQAVSYTTRTLNARINEQFVTNYFLGQKNQYREKAISAGYTLDVDLIAEYESIIKMENVEFDPNFDYAPEVIEAFRKAGKLPKDYKKSDKKEVKKPEEDKDELTGILTKQNLQDAFKGISND